MGKDGNVTLNKSAVPLDEGSDDDDRSRQPSREFGQLAIGYHHTIVLTVEGKMYCWGRGDDGQIGDGEEYDRKTPVQVTVTRSVKGKNVEELIYQVATGGFSSFALSKGGILYSWGRGQFGQLGHGDTEMRLTPTPVEALRSRILIAIAAGFNYAVAISEQGNLYSWGMGAYGNLGHGDNIDQALPKIIDSVLGKKFMQVACGAKHAAAVTTTGQVYTWGNGSQGRLGLGEHAGYFKPGLVEMLGKKRVIFIAASESHSLAVTAGGSVYAWGMGEYGKLGNGETAQAFTPVLIRSLESLNTVKVFCSPFHSMSLTKSGEVYSWGGGCYGKLGHVSEKNEHRPRMVADLIGKRVRDICCGPYHSVVVTETGDTLAWGYGGSGKLGNGSDTSTNFPAYVPALQGRMGFRGRQNDTAVERRGHRTDEPEDLEDDAAEAQGPRPKTRREALKGNLLQVDASAKDFALVDAGSAHSIGLNLNGTVFSWGHGENGRLGVGNLADQHHAEVVKALVGKNVIDVAAGYKHNMALTADGELYAWGYGSDGRLNVGVAEDQAIPALVDLKDNIKSFACGETHNLVVTEHGEVWAWGTGDFGKLGTGEMKNLENGERIDFATSVIKVACGSAHSAAITEQGELYTWGSGWDGKTGHEDTANVLVPKKVRGLKGKAVQDVACGAFHTVCVLVSGELYAWGKGQDGRLGLGDIKDRVKPTQLTKLENVFITNAAAGESHSACVSEDKGKVWTWGKGNYGQLGNGDSVSFFFPGEVKFPIPVEIVQVACGSNHTLALSENGALFCWGRGAFGRLGTGKREDEYLPFLVVRPRKAAPDVLAQIAEIQKQKAKADRERKGETESQEEGNEVDAELDGFNEDDYGFDITAEEVHRILHSENRDIDSEVKNYVKHLTEIEDAIMTELTENIDMEDSVAASTTKIVLLLKNRIDTDEKLSSLRGHSLQTSSKASVTALYDEDLLEFPHEEYAALFFYLKTKPKYLAALIKSARKEIYPMLIEAVYDCIFKYREGDTRESTQQNEEMLLKLLQMVLKEEIVLSKTIQGAVLPDSPPGVFLDRFARWGRNLDVVIETTSGIVDHMLDLEQLNLDLHPKRVYEGILAENESAFEDYQISEDPTLSEISGLEPVKAVLTSRVEQAQTLAELFLSRMSESPDRLPHGVRWISKVLRETAQDKFPHSPKADVASCVGRFFYQSYYSTVMMHTEQYKDIKLTRQQRMNLVTVGRIVGNITAGIAFKPEEMALKVLAPFCAKRRHAWVSYLDRLCAVGGLACEKVGRIAQTGTRVTSVISMPLPLIYSFHRHLLDQLGGVSQNSKDALRNLLNAFDRKYPLSNCQSSSIVHFKPSIHLLAKMKDQEGGGDDQQQRKADEDEEDEYSSAKQQIRKTLLAIDVFPPGSERNFKDSLLDLKDRAIAEHNFQLASTIEKAVVDLTSVEQQGYLSGYHGKDKYARILNDVQQDIEERARHHDELRRDLSKALESKATLDREKQSLVETAELFEKYLGNVKRGVFRHCYQLPNEEDPTVAYEEYWVGGWRSFPLKRLVQWEILSKVPLERSRYKRADIHISSPAPGKFLMIVHSRDTTFKLGEFDLEDLLDKRGRSIGQLKVDMGLLNVSRLVDFLNLCFYEKHIIPKAFSKKQWTRKI